MSTAALLRAVISLHPASNTADLPSPATNLVPHRNKISGKMRNTLQQRASHEPQKRPSSGLVVNGERTSPRSASVPLLQQSSEAAKVTGSSTKPQQLHHSIRTASPKRGAEFLRDELDEDERLLALQRKHFAKKSILRTRRVRHPVVTDTPRGTAVSSERPVLPLRRRQADVLASCPFSDDEGDHPLADGCQLPKLSVTGGIRRLVPRLAKIPHLYSEFPR